MQESDYQIRFGGIERLYGRDGLKRLRAAHVCVIGIGGVGSWVVEALGRSGVGRMTLVDLDEVCVSNINRQLPAQTSTVGKSKVEVMAARLREINPGIQVDARIEFFTEATADQIFAQPYDFVCDAIDNAPNKCRLLALCRDKKIPVITIGGAGGRRDPAEVRIADLARSIQDPLLQQVRKSLRKEHGFPGGSKRLFGMPCVFSPEPPRYPHEDGTVCAAPELGADNRLNCESGFGTAVFVTGAFGFLAASYIVSAIATGEPPPLS